MLCGRFLVFRHSEVVELIVLHGCCMTQNWEAIKFMLITLYQAATETPIHERCIDKVFENYDPERTGRFHADRNCSHRSATYGSSRGRMCVCQRYEIGKNNRQLVVGMDYSCYDEKKNYWVGATPWYQCVAEDSKIPKMRVVNPLQALVYPQTQKSVLHGLSIPNPNFSEFAFFCK